MPSYLSPGVYVEEVSYSAPTIEGVGTTTTAFAGPTLTGPVSGMPYGGLPASGSAVAGSPAPTVPQLLSSFGDFQNIYGGYADLSLTVSSENVNPASMVDVNYMAMAVQAFFLNGGSALYVSRVFANNPGATEGTIDPGIAVSGTASASDVVVQGRFPGAFLNTQTVSVALTATRVLNFNNLANLPTGSLLGEPGAGDGAPTLYANGTGTTFMSNATVPAALTAGTFPAKLYVLTVQVTAPGANGPADGLQRSGARSQPPELHREYPGRKSAATDRSIAEPDMVQHRKLPLDGLCAVRSPLPNLDRSLDNTGIMEGLERIHCRPGHHGFARQH